jgi:hypothetical protein
MREIEITHYKPNGLNSSIRFITFPFPYFHILASLPYFSFYFFDFFIRIKDKAEKYYHCCSNIAELTAIIFW